MVRLFLRKFLGETQAQPAKEALSPEGVVLHIQQGNVRLRNQFITEYQPYVAKVTSSFCKRYIDPVRDDEFSIALIAFNQAIDQFVPETGRSFLSFAETVMRRRLIDYVRKQKRVVGQVPYSSFENEDDDPQHNLVDNQQAMEHYEQQKVLEERNGEIVEFSRALAAFDIRFSELAAISPKHKDARLSLFSIGYRLSKNPLLMRELITRRLLPVKELLEQVDVSRKTIERNRKTIIAIALIFNGPYPYLRDYLSVPPECEERSDAE